MINIVISTLIVIINEITDRIIIITNQFVWKKIFSCLGCPAKINS